MHNFLMATNHNQHIKHKTNSNKTFTHHYPCSWVWDHTHGYKYIDENSECIVPVQEIAMYSFYGASSMVEPLG